MPILYNIDQEKNLVSIIVTGKTEKSEWYDLFEKIKNDEKRNEAMNVLLDFRNHETVVESEVVY